MAEAKAKFNLKQTVQKATGYVKEYWNKPPKNKFLSIKEWVAFCVGGMGASTALSAPTTYMVLTAGIYMAAALNINVWHITIIGIISNIINILRSPLIASVVDNVQTKRFGKFRIYLVALALPLFLLVVGTAWVPSLIAFNRPITDPSATYMGVLISFTVLYNLMQIVLQFYTIGFNSLMQVISPSPEERTNIMSFGTFVYSLGPSIVNILIPALANLLFSYGGQSGNGINNIKTFLYIIPIFMGICLALGLLVAFGTEERVHLPKNVKQKIGLVKGIKLLSHNKYFWLRLSSDLLGIFRLLGTTFTAWICTYMINNAFAYSLAVTLIGLAYNPGLLLSPWLINKLGKKKLTIISYLFTGVATVPMAILAFTATEANAVWLGVILLIINFLIIVMYGFTTVLTPAMQAQIYDYSQYKDGVRIEGFASQFILMISSAVGIGTALVAPAVYAKFGYETDASVLYNMDVLGKIIGVMCIIGTVSAVLSAIPYFFWDLDEKKHRKIMDVLEVRNKFTEGEIDEATKNDLEARIEAGEQNVLDIFKPAEVEETEAEVGETAEVVAETTATVETTEAVETAEVNETATETVETVETTEVSETAEADTTEQN